MLPDKRLLFFARANGGERRELLFIRWSDHDEGTAAVGRGIAQPVAFNRQGSRRIKRTKLNSFVKQRASTAIDNPRLFVFGVLRVVVFRVTASSFTFIIHHRNKTNAP